MDKEKALEAALSQIEKAFGKGSVMKLGQKGGFEDVDVISSGSIGLDMALGIGGFPRGRIIEIFGPESSGKAEDEWLCQHPTATGKGLSD